jgi:ribose transport system ATP-binding protein
VATIYQELDLVDDLTVAESIFLAHEPRRGPLLDFDHMHGETRALLARLGHESISPRTKVRALRPASQQIVSIARALSVDVRLLIMDEPSAILDDGGISIPFAGDVSDEAQARACVEAALDEYGRLDVLINNAGVLQHS